LNEKGIQFFRKLKCFLWRERKVFPQPATNNQPQTMDTYYAAPLNAKGTCFRLVIAAEPTKTAKHIKTKAKKN
jgi:hypothetical protein